jgi:ferredoxin
MEFLEKLFNDFIDRYKFSVIYREQNFPLFIYNGLLNSLPPLKSINFILSASMAGNDTIAFYNETPPFSIYQKPINGASLFISLSFKRIYAPTLFVNNIEHLAKILPFSFNQSKKHRLPINIVLGSTIKINFKSITLGIENIEFIKPTLGKLGNQDIDDIYKSLENIKADFEATFPHSTEHIDILSLNRKDGYFPAYLTPESSPPINIEVSDCVKVYSSELTTIKTIKYQFKLPVKLKTLPEEEICLIEDKLCPGCPFVIIIFKLKLSSIKIFSDIQCHSIQSIYNINYANLIDFLGYIYTMKRDKHCFIGNASYSETHHQRITENLIFLNNTNINMPCLNTVRKPLSIKKMHSLFPYSCNNILRFKPLSVKETKCKCLSFNKKPICIENTYCPALFIEHDKIFINEKLCVGCRMCSLFCPYRAIK